MRTPSRLAAWLALVLLLSLGLTGCYRSIGGSLEPTQWSAGAAQFGASTPLPLPTFTLPGAAPTLEQATGLASPLPASPTPFPTLAPPTEMGLPAPPVEGQGGGPEGGIGFAPTLTDTPVMVAAAPTSTPTTIPPTPTPLPSATPTAIPPTNTPLPTDTPSIRPSDTPTVPPLPVIRPSLTFTAVPFIPIAPTATYTPFVPAGAPVEAQPLAERPPESLPTIPAAEQSGGFLPTPFVAAAAPTFTPLPLPTLTPEPLEIAQAPTLTGGQMTATQIVYETTATAAATLGLVLPSLTPMPGQQVQVGGQQVIYVTATPAVPGGICSEYLVLPGDTLYRIAQRYGVTVNQIAQANNIVNPDLIRAGYPLQIPCPVPATPTPIPTQPVTLPDGSGGYAGGPLIYTVQAGDNIYRLSVRFGVSMEEIMAANGLTVATMNLIYVGQELVIPGAAVTVTPTPVVGAGGAAPVYIVVTSTPTPGFAG